MGIENSFKSFRNDVRKATQSKQDTSIVLSYEEGIEAVRESLKKVLVENFEEEMNSSKDTENVVKDKAYLRKVKESYFEKISDIVYQENLRIREYEDISKFIGEAVEEFCGYSILADAFDENSGISDIYCIQWNKIYVEKNGKNEKYPKTFRSPKHYKDFIERILRVAEKEVNNGENKIVDFDIYGDRYCVTSKAVSPKDYSVTIRKHTENHIKLNQIIDSGVMNQKEADLLGTFILGECNLIYAGITGSGKTTSMRALLDWYVAEANKRMIVCEDTQELFPNNDHTLELVSIKNADQELAIPLSKLIVTALRLKPKYIVIGEVRGPEIESAVEGMATGHSTILSMHGGTPIDVVNRIITKYLMAMPSLGVDVVERIIGSALDYIVLQDDIPGIGRKVTSITEVTYNYQTRRVDLKTIAKFDFSINDIVYVNKISPEKAEKMLRRGIPMDKLKPLVEGWS